MPLTCELGNISPVTMYANYAYIDVILITILEIQTSI